MKNALWVIAFVKDSKVPVFWSLALVAPPARIKQLHMIPIVPIPRVCWQDARHLIDRDC